MDCVRSFQHAKFVLILFGSWILFWQSSNFLDIVRFNWREKNQKIYRVAHYAVFSKIHTINNLSNHSCQWGCMSLVTHLSIKMSKNNDTPLCLPSFFLYILFLRKICCQILKLTDLSKVKENPFAEIFQLEKKIK